MNLDEDGACGSGAIWTETDKAHTVVWADLDVSARLMPLSLSFQK